jgi:hypothetical protein
MDLNEDNSINPQMLTFLKALDNCQFCTNPKGPIYCYYTSIGPKMGYVTCEKCCEAGMNAVNLYMKTKAYGEANYLMNKTFNVKSSSGEIESGWKLDPEYTFVDKKWNTNEYGVYCLNSDGKVSKCVLISDLLELNPK